MEYISGGKMAVIWLNPFHRNPGLKACERLPRRKLERTTGTIGQKGRSRPYHWLGNEHLLPTLGLQWIQNFELHPTSCKVGCSKLGEYSGGGHLGRAGKMTHVKPTWRVQEMGKLLRQANFPEGEGKSAIKIETKKATVVTDVFFRMHMNNTAPMGYQ